jgi:hypothetical protein
MDAENGIVRLCAQARGHLGPIKWAYEKVFGRDEPFEDALVLGPLQVFLANHPMMTATKRHAAIHEAGHFVLFEHLGLVAGTAAVYGSAFGRDGWGGEANDWNSACHSLRDPDPDAFLCDAQGAWAGPLAEDLIGGGDALSSVGELAQGALLAERAGQLRDRHETEARHEALLGAIALVEHHAREILEIAAFLERRGRISSAQPSIRKILARVKQTPIDARAVSKRGEGLFRKIEDALGELQR